MSDRNELERLIQIEREAASVVDKAEREAERVKDAARKEAEAAHLEALRATREDVEARLEADRVRFEEERNEQIEAFRKRLAETPTDDRKFGETVRRIVGEELR